MQSTTSTAPQGIMTTEVGAITGEVVIDTQEIPNGVEVTVAYEGAEDTYTVEGSPAESGHSHEEIVQMLLAETGKATRLT